MKKAKSSVVWLLNVALVGGGLAFAGSGFAQPPRNKRVTPRVKKARKRVRAKARTVKTLDLHRLAVVAAPVIHRLPDQKLTGQFHKPSVIIWLPRNFTAPTELMSTSVWMPKRKRAIPKL